MYTSDPRDALTLAHERAGRLQREAEAERLRQAAGRRGVLAASLRRVADRLDPAPLAPRLGGAR